MDFAEAEDRICAECSHLVGKRIYVEDAKNWRCHAKQNLISAEKDQVTGAMVYALHYPTCYDARKNAWKAIFLADNTQDRQLTSCGEVGQWFEKYTHPEYIHQRKQPKAAPGSITMIDPEQLLKELE